MSTCRNVKSKSEFYNQLADLIHHDHFVVELATEIVGLYNTVKACLSLADCNVPLLRKMHHGYHKSEDLGDMDNLARAAFKDLSPHFRWAPARVAFQKLTEMSGTAGDDDLFINLVGSRPLDEDSRFAVVTLVVDSREGFESLLRNEDAPTTVHVV